MSYDASLFERTGGGFGLSQRAKHFWSNHFNNSIRLPIQMVTLGGLQRILPTPFRFAVLSISIVLLWGFLILMWKKRNGKFEDIDLIDSFNYQRDWFKKHIVIMRVILLLWILALVDSTFLYLSDLWSEP